MALSACEGLEILSRVEVRTVGGVLKGASERERSVDVTTPTFLRCLDIVYGGNPT